MKRMLCWRALHAVGALPRLVCRWELPRHVNYVTEILPTMTVEG